MYIAALALACLLSIYAVVAQAVEQPRPPVQQSRPPTPPYQRQPDALRPELLRPETLRAPDASPRPRVADPARHAPDPQHSRTCFNSAETREKIISRRLSEPFRLLRGAAGHLQGDALRAKLCRWNDDYVYDIAFLRRDGRVVHVYLNATSGQTVGAFNDR